MRLVREPEFIEEVEQADRSTTVRRLLAKAVREWKLEYRARQCGDGKFTLARAARGADAPLWEMTGPVRDSRVAVQYALEDLRQDLGTSSGSVARARRCHGRGSITAHNNVGSSLGNLLPGLHCRKAEPGRAPCRNAAASIGNAPSEARIFSSQTANSSTWASSRPRVIPIPVCISPSCSPLEPVPRVRTRTAQSRSTTLNPDFVGAMRGCNRLARSGKACVRASLIAGLPSVTR